MASENPLLYRLSLARRRRSWIRHPMLEGALLAVLFGLPLALMPRDKEPVVLWCLFASLYFCARPLLSAVATIAAERQRGTFECLVTTGFSARSWIATLWWECVRIPLAQLPLAFVPLLLAHHRVQEGLLALFFSLASSISFYAAAGLWLSSRSRTLAAANLRATLFLTSTFFLSMAADVLIFCGIFQQTQSGPAFCQWVSPWLLCAFLLIDGTVTIGAGWMAVVLVQTVLAVGCLLASATLLARPAHAARPRALGAGPARWLAARISHPIFYRSLLLGARQRFWLGRLLVLPISLAAFPILLPRLLGRTGDFELNAEPLRSILMLGMLLLALYLTVRVSLTASQAVAGEKDTRCWEHLLSTPVRVGSMVGSMWLACVVPAVLECSLNGGAMVAYAHHYRAHWEDVLFAILYLAIWTVFVASFALWQSCRCRTASAALGRTAGLVLGLIVAGLVLYLLDYSSVRHLGWFSPFTVLTLTLEGRMGLEVALPACAFYSASTLGCLLGAALSLRRNRL